MKSIEVIVPRKLIKKFYLHPEPYGDGAYVVDLINGMFTDVFYREEGGYNHHYWKRFDYLFKEESINFKGLFLSGWSLFVSSNQG